MSTNAKRKTEATDPGTKMIQGQATPLNVIPRQEPELSERMAHYLKNGVSGKKQKGYGMYTKQGRKANATLERLSTALIFALDDMDDVSALYLYEKCKLIKNNKEKPNTQICLAPIIEVLLEKIIKSRTNFI